MNCYPTSIPNKDQLNQLKIQRAEILKNSSKEEPHFEPLTLDEKRSIFKAMGHELRGSGHYYKCSKGHTYTVGACGSPCIASLCECGATIGAGSPDHLDMDFEQMYSQGL